jgi:hypothetical protein
VFNLLFFSFFFSELGFELRDYNLSHSTRSFFGVCVGYFQERVFVQAGFEP